MKPDWKDAPEWAQWLAMDRNGDWYWYENKPLLLNSIWAYADDDESIHERACHASQNWRHSLEQRP